jgi:hypothetical protein
LNEAVQKLEANREQDSLERLERERWQNDHDFDHDSAISSAENRNSKISRIY